MIRFMKYVVLGVVAVLLLLFASANRQTVIVSFDPFSSSAADAAFAIPAPLFAVVIVFAMLGVVAGASATWFAQGRYRRAARRHRAEAERLRAESDALKAAQPRPSATALPGR